MCKLCDLYHPLCTYPYVWLLLATSVGTAVELRRVAGSNVAVRNVPRRVSHTPGRVTGIMLSASTRVRDPCLLQVVGLLLGCNGLRGVMSPSLGLLSTLRVLDLSGNSLKGTRNHP